VSQSTISSSSPSPLQLLDPSFLLGTSERESERGGGGGGGFTLWEGSEGVEQLQADVAYLKSRRHLEAEVCCAVYR
jgi:hypothetical protein